jgi:RHS repeat-associated protein
LGQRDELAWARYFYTGQERDEETGLQNFRARFYDEDLFRFCAMDPAGQQVSPYAFVGNTPLMGVDRDGRLWHILIGAVIGAGINIYSNWDAIQSADGSINWGKFGAFASVGALAGGVGAATGGWGVPLSGAISGGGNAWIRGENILLGAGIGGASAFVGGQLANKIAPSISSFLGNLSINGTQLSSIPVLHNGLTSGLVGSASGGIIGGGLGGTMSWFNGGSFSEGFSEGFRGGLKTGAISGTIAGTASTIGNYLREGKNPFGSIRNTETSTPKTEIPEIKGTVKDLRNPEVAKQIAKDMLNEKFDYTEKRAKIGGHVDKEGTYYVGEGHHRVAAAMQIFLTTGNPTPLMLLLQNGLWTPTVQPPTQTYPIPKLKIKIRND